MRTSFKNVFVLALAGSLAGCGDSSPSPAQPSSSGISVSARAYLDELLGIMQANSINRYRIDWSSFREAVFAAAPNAQTIADLCATAIPTSLGRLGDHHSFYVTSNGAYVTNPNPRGRCSDPLAGSAETPAGVGYVRIGAFSGPDQVEFAISVENQIRASDAPSLLGWIVDLRGNGGGNMWPMIAGVGPVLGEGTAGAFVDPDKKVSLWGYANGASIADGYPQVQVPDPYRLHRPNPRVAVLTDCRVASSGEAVVVAFRGRPNTRSFGTPTNGVSTANRTFRLSDGASLYLTISTMADRKLTLYGDVIVPDEVIGDPAATVQRAIAWLHDP